MLPASAVIVLIPLLGGAAAFLLRRLPTVQIAVAAGLCALAVLLLSQPIDATVLGIDLDGRLNLLGRVMRVHEQDRLALLTLFVCAALLLIASWRTPGLGAFAPVGMLLLSAWSAALMVRPVQYAGLIFVVAGALGTLMIQAERDELASTLGARRFLVSSVLALPAFLGAGYLAQRASAAGELNAVASYEPAVVLLLLGAGLVMGALPLFTWVYATAQDAPPLAMAFLSTVGAGAVAFLLLTFMREFEWFRSSNALLTALRTGGMILLITSALLSWTQQTLGKLMGSALLLDLGCVLLAAVGQTQQGAEAIAFGILGRAASLGLFGIGAAWLRDRSGGDDLDAIRGRGARETWAALAVAVGGLSLAGFPGTVGFVSAWTTMRAPGVDVETIVVIVLAGVSVGVGVLRILHALFDGENKAESEAGNEQEPMSSQRWTIVVLVALVLLLGIFPALIAPLAQATAAGFF
jgi:formate hydrogenlyase subunit 3/multisubunit Na+/H+ antiporter MnhD subunit